jgi:predicted DNA-binding WGR domain protein
MSSSPSTQRVQLVVLDRVDERRNMARYYVLSIEPTLFDDIALVREWGRIGKPGRRRIELHRDHDTARVALGAWFARKLKRGYRARPACSGLRSDRSDTPAIS